MPLQAHLDGQHPMQRTSFRVLGLLDDSATVFISDSLTPKCVNAFTVRITSPNRARWSDFEKELDCRLLYFPVFSWDEILQLQQSCFRDVEGGAEGAADRYARWGGIPRYVLGKTCESDQMKLESAMSKPDYRQLADLLGQVELKSDAVVSHRLLHLKVRGELGPRQVVPAPTARALGRAVTLPLRLRAIQPLACAPRQGQSLRPLPAHLVVRCRCRFTSMRWPLRIYCPGEPGITGAAAGPAPAPAGARATASSACSLSFSARRAAISSACRSFAARKSSRALAAATKERTELCSVSGTDPVSGCGFSEDCGPPRSASSTVFLMWIMPWAMYSTMYASAGGSASSMVPMLLSLRHVAT